MNDLVTGYHNAIFDHKRRKDAVNHVSNKLRHFRREVGIVCTGLSGILVGVPAAEKTKREFAIIRKPGEKTYSSYNVEGYRFKNYVIVDDFIDKGKTMRRIIKLLEYRSHCVGIILYAQNYKTTFKYKKENVPVYHVNKFS